MNVEELRNGTVHLSARTSQARQTGSSEFPTAMLAGCLLTSGRWYYECRVQNDARGGVWQLGFFDTKFQGSTSDGVGVGDDKHSWAYDGARKCLWHGLHGPTDWGVESGAPKGSVVGVAVDLDSKTLSFFIDGKPADGKTGVAFRQIEIAHGLTVRQRCTCPLPPSLNFFCPPRSQKTFRTALPSLSPPAPPILLQPGVTFQNPTELVLNCGPGAGSEFDFTPPAGFHGVGEWIAAESQESAMRTTAYSYWASPAAAGGDGAAADGAASPGPPSPLRRTMSALTPALSERETLPLRCTSGHMQTLLDQQDRIVSASARYVSVVGALEGGELLWAAAASKARGGGAVSKAESTAESPLDGSALFAACRADAEAWYFETTVTRRRKKKKKKKKRKSGGADLMQSADATTTTPAWSDAKRRAEFAVGWATPRFFGDYKKDGAAGGVGGDDESWALVECDGRLWACHGAEGAASTRVPCVSLSYEGGPITFEVGSTVSCAARVVTKDATGRAAGSATVARIEMRWAINGTWLDFSAGASGTQRGAHFVHRVEPLATEALAHGGLRPAVSAAGGSSLQLNFGERAFDYAEMLALPAGSFSVHTTELKRLGRDRCVLIYRYILNEFC